MEFEYVETPHGRGVRIHDLEGLLGAIADRIISGPARLRRQEVRFLRSMLDPVAGRLGAHAWPRTVERGAVGREIAVSRIPGASDRALRLFYTAQVTGGKAAKRLSNLLKELDEAEHANREERFRDAHGWRTAARAKHMTAQQHPPPHRSTAVGGTRWTQMVPRYERERPGVLVPHMQKMTVTNLSDLNKLP